MESLTLCNWSIELFITIRTLVVRFISHPAMTKIRYECLRLQVFHYINLNFVAVKQRMYHSKKQNSSYHLVKNVSDLTEPKACDDSVNAICASKCSSVLSIPNARAPFGVQNTKNQRSQCKQLGHPQVQRSRKFWERFIRTEQSSRTERVIHIVEQCSCIEMETFNCVDSDKSNEDVKWRSIIKSKCPSCEDFKQYAENFIDDPCSCFDPILPYQDGVPYGEPKQEYEKQAELVLDDLCIHPILPISLSCLMCFAWI